MRGGAAASHSPVAKSRELLAELWRQAVAVSAPQSLPAHRFINSLDEMTKLQEGLLFMLLGVAIVAIGLTGYQSGLTQSHVHAATLMMAVTVAVVIVLVVDLDQPARGLIQVPTQALVDVARDIGP